MPRNAPFQPHTTSTARVGEIMRFARVRRGTKKTEISDATGIDRATLTKLESGDRKRITADSAINIAHFLGLSVDGFLGTPQWDLSLRFHTLEALLHMTRIADLSRVAAAIHEGLLSTDPRFEQTRITLSVGDEKAVWFCGESSGFCVSPCIAPATPPAGLLPSIQEIRSTHPTSTLPQPTMPQLKAPFDIGQIDVFGPTEGAIDYQSVLEEIAIMTQDRIHRGLDSEEGSSAIQPPTTIEPVILNLLAQRGMLAVVLDVEGVVRRAVDSSMSSMLAAPVENWIHANCREGFREALHLCKAMGVAQNLRLQDARGDWFTVDLTPMPQQDQAAILWVATPATEAEQLTKTLSELRVSNQILEGTAEIAQTAWTAGDNIEKCYDQLGAALMRTANLPNLTLIICEDNHNYIARSRIARYGRTSPDKGARGLVGKRYPYGTAAQNTTVIERMRLSSDDDWEILSPEQISQDQILSEADSFDESPVLCIGLQGRATSARIGTILCIRGPQADLEDIISDENFPRLHPLFSEAASVIGQCQDIARLKRQVKILDGKNTMELHVRLLDNLIKESYSWDLDTTIDRIAHHIVEHNILRSTAFYLVDGDDLVFTYTLAHAGHESEDMVLLPRDRVELQKTRQTTEIGERHALNDTGHSAVRCFDQGSILGTPHPQRSGESCFWLPMAGLAQQPIAVMATGCTKSGEDWMMEKFEFLKGPIDRLGERIAHG